MSRSALARVWADVVTTETRVVERIRHIEVHGQPARLVNDRHAGMAQRAGRLCRFTRFHLVRIRLFVFGFVVASVAVLTGIGRASVPDKTGVQGSMGLVR